MYKAINSKEHCLLESPTGTGKTLSILTSALGWLHNQHKNKLNGDCKIFYATRTHSQIKQLVKELKATCYNPIIALLGSRDQLCVNKDLNDIYGAEKNNKCNNLTKIKACSYYENLEKIRKVAVTEYSRKVMDIEELVKNSFLLKLIFLG
jgi:regulator of telomere elongation helicase 1